MRKVVNTVSRYSGGRSCHAAGGRFFRSAMAQSFGRTVPDSCFSGFGLIVGLRVTESAGRRLDPRYKRVCRALKNCLKCVLRNGEIGRIGLAGYESVFTREGDAPPVVVAAAA